MVLAITRGILHIFLRRLRHFSPFCAASPTMFLGHRVDFPKFVVLALVSSPSYFLGFLGLQPGMLDSSGDGVGLLVLALV